LEESAKFVLSPPIRAKKDNQYLWNALKNGAVSTIGTDHCPFNLKEKTGAEDFTKIPNGGGGIEHRLTLLYTFGVTTKIITINRFVELVSANPAKIFGLYPAKGLIAPGSDADIVIWDNAKENTISARTHVEKNDNTIFEGFKTKGSAKIVIAGGTIVYQEGRFYGKEKGRFIKRAAACF